MDIQQLRQSLKMKWLNYYEQNRHWLIKLKIWRYYDGLRRPSSGYMLAILSVIEPKFEEVLAFILELNTDPDQIITALGLHFNPDEELSLTKLNNAQINQQVVDDQKSVSTLVSQATQQRKVRENQPLLFKVVMGGEQKRRPVAVVGVNKAVEKQEQKSLASPTLHIPASLTLSTVPTPPKTIPFPNNRQFPHTYQPNFSNQKMTLHYTNATRLESWIDEFCPGVKSEPD
jgi:hypothetical protein